MTPLLLALVLFIAAIGLLAAELILPTGGLLGVGGAVALLVAIGACFWINPWVGLGALVATLACLPILASWFTQAWPRSVLGRRFVLQPVRNDRSQLPVQIGQIGIAYSELRPTGEVDFGDLRLEAMSEFGMISAGQSVRVVGFSDGRPRVRIATDGQANVGTHEPSANA
jgi:membrane-bound ClpP family serine protease